VTIPPVSNNSEDKVTNTWHFTCTSFDETTQGQVQTALVAWYEAVDSWKSDIMYWQNSRVKWFNMSEPEPRVPIEDELLGLTAAGSTDPLPPELAVVMSFHGEYVSGYSQSRRRGRIYFGPLTTGIIDTTAGRLSTVACTAFATAGGSLLTASNAASGWAWVVYSPTGATAYPVVDGWVDNAPDVQRRRGLDATVRTAFI